MTHVPTILLTGRANVGKSTLFNRLVATSGLRADLQPQAIVSEKAGATRDIISADVRWHDLHFNLLDGAGWSERPASELQKTVAAHSRKALENADIILFLYDAKAGLLPEDKALADFFRRLNIPILPVANKCESKHAEPMSGEAYALGFGEPIGLSALQGDGLHDLYESLRRHIMPVSEEEENAGSASGDNRIRICILGRPNVGKSTLVNLLLGEEKALVADMAGLTRDAVEYPIGYEDEEFLLLDTAGLRKRARVQEDLEQLSVGRSLKALQYSDVAVLVIDASENVQKQDLTLAKLIADEGRAPVIVLNKWDLVKDKKARMRDITERLESGFAQVKGVRCVPLSALKTKRIEFFWQSVKQSYEAWNKRISTGHLNRWLKDCVDENPPPMESGRRLKIRYMTQAKTRPPTFILFASQAGKNKGDGALPTQYIRFLRNRLQKDFDINGVPLRLRTART